MDPVAQPFRDEIEIQRQRLLWLARLRWYAATAMVVATLAGRYLLQIENMPVLFLLVLAFIIGAYNYLFFKRVKEPVFPPYLALLQILFDVVALTLSLLFTGGFLNPFFTVYFSQVIIAWIMLPVRQGIGVTLFVTLCFAMQGLATNELDMEAMGDLHFHVIGAPVSFVFTTVITAYFAFIIMQDLRKREREVRHARQQAELELNKLDNILRHIGGGMVVTDVFGSVSWTNDQIKNWFGGSANSGEAWQKILRIARSVYSADQTQPHHELQLPTKGQGTRIFEIIVTPVADLKGELQQTIQLILDVTQQKRNQEQWAQAQRLAAVGQLAAGVAHEINTPLGTINILASEALRTVHESQETLPDDLEDALETIHQQTRRCKEITQTLLNFSRKPVTQREPLSVNEMAQTALDLLKHRLEPVTVSAKFDPSLPEITSDRSGMERAVFNLLLNALDAFEQNHPNPSIELETRQENGCVQIRIRDNGCGIPEEHLPRVFEPFYTTKDVGKGTGLGLYITYGIIQDAGGELTIHSKENEGTEAVIALPVYHE